MSCAPHVPLPDVPAEAADAEDEGGDVPGRLEDLPVRTGAAAGAENATKAMIWRNCLSFMSTDYWRFYSNTIAGGGRSPPLLIPSSIRRAVRKSPGLSIRRFVCQAGSICRGKRSRRGCRRSRRRSAGMSRRRTALRNRGRVPRP